MSLSMPERLYRLLPSVYRLRDADHGEPLRALLAVIERELERVEGDTARLYDDWFIETCDEWVVPYIGDLLGVRSIRSVESARVSARAYVANTIAYRRRKGTAVVLEQLARDTTGWVARAVEFFTLLATTQHTNHVRLAPTATPAIREAATAELADTAFDTFAHSAEVRRAATRGGRYNIHHVGIYLWRLRSYTVGAGEPGDEAADFATARPMGDWWSFHPAGRAAPLFNTERTEATITHLAEEHNVPGTLRRLALNAELERLRNGVDSPAPRFMTADDPVLRLWVRLAGESQPVEVRREDIYICTIPHAVELEIPTPRACALDPMRGRLAFPAALPVREVWVQHRYGFSGDLGGGSYDRGDAAIAASQAISIQSEIAGQAQGFHARDVWQVGVSHLLPDDGVTLFPSLRDAIAAWNEQASGLTGVIVMMDSLSDHGAADGAPIEVMLGERSRLLIVAGTWRREPIPGVPGSLARVPGRFEARQVRAHVVGDIVVRGVAAESSTDPGACFLNGLLLEGRITVAPGNLGNLALAHCTVIPGAGALAVDAGNDRLLVTLDKSICGSITVLGPARGIHVNDSIVGNGDGSPEIALDATQSPLALQRCTFFGGVRGLTLSATDCIFDGTVYAERRQAGCVRFSYVPRDSAVPRRYRCQPSLEIATRLDALRNALKPQSPSQAQETALVADVDAQMRPLFVSRVYGDPGYGQLELRCAQQIRRGAESGAEMGAFEFLKQPQREANLRDALDEYLRFGLEANVIFVT
jgi:hypothetical protein